MPDTRSQLDELKSALEPAADYATASLRFWWGTGPDSFLTSLWDSPTLAAFREPL